MPDQAMQAQPNILFIMADDLGYADLSCYGRQEYETPALDGLAAQGVRFTDAYANSSVCSATRVALMTGRYQYRLPVGLEEPLQGRGLGLPPEHPTLPSLLRDQGYVTSLVGKWHLGALPNYCPLKSGYDEFWGIRGGGVDYFTHELDGTPDLWDGTTAVEQQGYLTDLIAERCVETLARRAGEQRPFFISLHFTAPHWPWTGPNDEAESARLAAKQERLRIIHFDGGDMATYASMMQSLDDNVGRVLAELDRLELAEDTIVIFTSDNGGERFSNVWPFTGHKTELLEGGIRVPLIVRWLGHAPAGCVTRTPAMTMDFLPTLLAAAGGAPPAGAESDGIDLSRTLAGEPEPERILFWRFRNHGQRAARRGRWKYLRIAGNEFLFDVEADPLERGNLKDRYPEVFSSLEGKWEDWSATMLPEDPAAETHGFTGRQLAQYYGIDS
jgi:arylsulfatase A-like enzyme